MLLFFYICPRSETYKNKVSKVKIFYSFLFMFNCADQAVLFNEETQKGKLFFWSPNPY